MDEDGGVGEVSGGVAVAVGLDVGREVGGSLAEFEE